MNFSGMQKRLRQLGINKIHNMEFIGFTLDVIGKIMVAYTAIQVHFRFFKEHRVDERVFQIMKRERVVGIIGIALIIIGFVLQIPGKL